jgi:hypothetical protein
MSSFRLSVGIAACEEASALQRTLEGIFGQERPFDQVVVAQSQSSRAMTELLADYGSRVQVAPVPSGLTPIQQWNSLAPMLTEAWVSLLTPEDCPLPNFVHALQEAVGSSPGAAIVRAGWIRLRARGPGERYTLHSVRSVVKPAEALYEQRFGPKGSFAACALRRDVWEQVGWFPEETPLLGDWAMWLLAGALGETVRSREVIAEQRTAQHGSEFDLARKIEEIRETFLIYRDILPRATARAALENTTWIAAASRKRFRDVAIAASSKFHTDLRGPLIEALRPWAQSVEQESLLSRLEGGERIRDFNLARRLRPAIKRVISAVR